MSQRPPAASIIPAAVVCVAIVVMVAAARFRESWPIEPRECGFRESFGIPCMACGGTRAFMALSQGQFLEAFLFHPLAIIGVIGCACWLVFRLFSRRPIRVRTGLTIAVFLVAMVLNWIWLIRTLPE